MYRILRELFLYTIQSHTIMPDIPFAEKSFQDAGNHAKSCIKCTVDGGECFTSYFISARSHNRSFRS